ncbi:MAG: DNA mismatch repair protein MutS [Haloferacaceae archaeon]
MASVTGPPERLAESAEELTPMLRQYVEVCERYDDSLVLFRVGDFYKTFCATAEAVARTCDLTLIEREDSTGTYAAAGIPVENAATYIERLLDAGHRVAVADQVEDPDEADGLVERAVTRVVTPGTVVDDELLAPDATYLAAVARGDGGGSAGPPRALAAVDVSTGECLVTSAPDRDRLGDELARLGPAELLVGPDAADPRDLLDAEPRVTDEPNRFDRAAAAETLSAYVASPAAVVENDAELRACGAALSYAEFADGDDGPLGHVSRIRRYDPRDRLGLDAAAVRSLELFEGRGPGEGTPLFDAIDGTVSAPGRRRLSSWLRRPLVDRGAIEARLDAVAELADRSVARERVRDRLRAVYDIERLAGRVARGRADARDLRALAGTLAAVPDLRAALSDAGTDRLRDLRAALDPLPEVRERIEASIREDPPAELTEGGVIREGYDDDLDDLRATEREGRAWVADLEARERDRTGIDTLEVGHNRVHGYYIEVTDSNLDRVPDDYTRRQTLKNSERFYTPELKEREDEILGAAERADALEYDLFCEVRAAVADETDRLQALADAVAALDALAGLAAVAVERDYVRPTLVDGGGDAEGTEGAHGTDGTDVEGSAVTDGTDADASPGGPAFEVRAGRHPTVERTTEFVPNDVSLRRGTVAVVTGPNMSGKSTYMRQVALACVLAQAGSFVPADAARLPVVDRVFTRVGASDDIAGGESTFMREMAELTAVLHGATDRSLVLLDEVGRGTSTADGRAIARAAAEFLHDEVGATTLFATHYHDLTDLADDRERVRNLHFRVARDGDDPGDVTFLHRVAEGAASSSYGIEVARLAGVPEAVVERAYDLVGADGGGAPTLADFAEAADGAAGAGTNGSVAGDGASTGAGSAADADGGASTGGSDGSNAGNGRAGGDGAAAGSGRADDADTTAADDADGGGGCAAAAGDDPPADAAAVASAIRGMDLATTTPLDALNRLHDLQRRLRGDRE